MLNSRLQAPQSATQTAHQKKEDTHMRAFLFLVRLKGLEPTR